MESHLFRYAKPHIVTPHGTLRRTSYRRLKRHFKRENLDPNSPEDVISHFLGRVNPSKYADVIRFSEEGEIKEAKRVLDLMHLPYQVDLFLPGPVRRVVRAIPGIKSEVSISSNCLESFAGLHEDIEEAYGSREFSIEELREANQRGITTKLSRDGVFIVTRGKLVGYCTTKDLQGLIPKPQS